MSVVSYILLFFLPSLSSLVAYLASTHFVAMKNRMPSESRDFSCTLAVLLLLISAARAIEVTPNSLCATLCNNYYFSDPSVDHSWTLSPDVPCDDWEIVGSDSTIRGRKWKNCLSCESTSNATDAKTQQNDVYWMLCASTFLLPQTLNWMADRGRREGRQSTLNSH